MNNLEKTNKLPKQVQDYVDEMKAAEIFNAYLDKLPPTEYIKVNKMAGNYRYLPIGFLENEMDRLFMKLWQTKNFRWQVVANEIIGTIEIHYYHPVLRQWLCREGSASVMIQMKSEKNGGDGDITNVKNKITNTLEKDFPHLKADCFRNGVKSLGRRFGRDMNREDRVVIMESASKLFDDATALRKLNALMDNENINALMKSQQIQAIKRGLQDGMDSAMLHRTLTFVEDLVEGVKTQNAGLEPIKKNR